LTVIARQHPAQIFEAGGRALQLLRFERDQLRLSFECSVDHVRGRHVVGASDSVTCLTITVSLWREFDLVADVGCAVEAYDEAGSPGAGVDHHDPPRP
jgi:hypothetical protein